MGRGVLKPIPVTPRQQTLLSIMGEQADHSELRKERELSGEEAEEEREEIDAAKGEQEREVETTDEEEKMGLEHTREKVLESTSDKQQQKSDDEVMEADEVSSGEDVIEIEDNFDPDHPFLVRLREHLTSRHGKHRSKREANAISSAVSKYLAFAGPTLDLVNLYNVEKLDHYLKALEGQGCKASTQQAILCRVKQGLTYVHLLLDHAETLKAEKCLKLIANWLSTLGKEARWAKWIRLEDMVDNPGEEMTEIERFSHSDEINHSIQKAVNKVKKGKIIQSDF